MSDKLEEEINLYDKIIVKNYNNLSLAEQFEKGAVVKVDDELDKVKQQLAIAVSYLDVISELKGCKCFQCVDFARKARKKIKELEK